MGTTQAAKAILKPIQLDQCGGTTTQWAGQCDKSIWLAFGALENPVEIHFIVSPSLVQSALVQLVQRKQLAPLSSWSNNSRAVVLHGSRYDPLVES